MTTPTTNYGLLKAQGSDNARDYLKTSLAATLDSLDTILATAIKTGDTAVVTEALLALGAVTTNRLGDGAVTTAKLADAQVTAAKLAAAVGNFGAWTPWTPTVTQGVAVTVTTSFARYLLLGKLAVVRVHLTVASSGTAGSSIVIAGWPTAINPKDAAGYGAVGPMVWRDDSAGTLAVGVAAHASVTTLNLWTNTAASPLGADALASPDQIDFTLMYEVA